MATLATRHSFGLGEAMEFQPELAVVPSSDLDRIAQEAVRLGVPVYTFSVGDNEGRDAFFDAVRRTLPLDPPVLSSRSWDALTDSLWEGIYSLPDRQIVIIWTDAGQFKSASPQDHEVALSVLADVVQQLAQSAATVGNPKKVSVFVSR